MFTHRSFNRWIFYAAIILLLAACSDGGGSSVNLGQEGIVTQGIAVDPYIVGAVFQEIDPDTGTVLQESSPSDEGGVFHFEEPLTPGSIVEMVPGTGLHGGAPYQGELSRIVEMEDDGTIVVTPLTTLLSNGIAPQELIAVFADAGLTGLTVDDLYADPMAGLADLSTGVADQDLKLLQASMAANGYMEVIGNFQAGMDELSDAEHFQIFSSMVAAMENLLNSQQFSDITTALADDPDISSPLIFEDYILAVVNQHRTIVSLAQENMVNNGGLNPAMIDQAVDNALSNNVAMVKNSYSQRVPITITYDGEQLYHDNCSACHRILSLTDVPGSTPADIQTAINQNFGGMGTLNNMTEGEITAIAGILPASPAATPAPTPTPPASQDPVAIDGTTLYGTNCSGCHNALASSDIADRSAAGIQSAIDSLAIMGSLSSLTTEQVQAIADALPAAAPAPTPAPTPTPPASQDPVAIDGTTLYGANCSGCHFDLASTEIPGRTANQIQSAIDANIGNMGFLSSLTPEEVQAIADALPAAAPAPTPAPTPTPPASQDPVAIDGAALYGTDCAICHGQLASSDIVDRSAAGIQSAIDTVGSMGSLSSLTSEQVQAIADVLPAADPTPAPDPGPDYSDCTACHGQPPSGSSYPDTAGAHEVHAALASVGNDCSVCHLGAAHNGQVDLGFPVDFDAQSGPATDNLDGTCSSVICHGGQTTPDWWTDSIAVDTQCTSCHSEGSSQFNSYSSGRHNKHVNGEGYDCTVCHNTDTLANGHFSNLETPDFELSPAATIGGGSTRVGNYSNGTCSSVECHGSESW